jgi:hypothetical protein
MLQVHGFSSLYANKKLAPNVKASFLILRKFTKDGKKGDGCELKSDLENLNSYH